MQGQPSEIQKDKTDLICEGIEDIKRDVNTHLIQKSGRKPVAPRFVSPITGMIVDQGTDVILEGIIDGE